MTLMAVAVGHVPRLSLPVEVGEEETRGLSRPTQCITRGLACLFGEGQRGAGRGKGRYDYDDDGAGGSDASAPVTVARRASRRTSEARE